MTAPAESRLWPQPGELWSLWDMLQINPRELIFLGERMEEFRRHWLDIEHLVLPAATDDDRQQLVRFIERLQELSANLEMPFAVQRRFDAARGHLPQSHSELHSLFCLFKDDAISRTALILDPPMAELLQQREPFGGEVTTKFRNVADELERAARCLALELPTACMFHLMRALEGVVQTLSGKLGVERLEREWGKLLSDMDAAIKAMPKSPEANAWSMARANLYHVKQAWRNDTMHPKQSYTVAEAKEVFVAMKTFMVHLAGLV